MLFLNGLKKHYNKFEPRCSRDENHIQSVLVAYASIFAENVRDLTILLDLLQLLIHNTLYMHDFSAYNAMKLTLPETLLYMYFKTYNIRRLWCLFSSSGSYCDLVHCAWMWCDVWFIVSIKCVERDIHDVTYHHNKETLGHRVLWQREWRFDVCMNWKYYIQISEMLIAFSFSCVSCGLLLWISS